MEVNVSKSGVRGYKWRKSTRSVGNGACIEVAAKAESVAVRAILTIKERSPVLSYTPKAWAKFV